MSNSKSVVELLLVGDHPFLGLVGDHLWQLSPGVSFESKVLVPNYKSVVHFFLVGEHPRIGG